MLYIGRFKKLIDCKRCEHIGPPWLCNGYTKEHHLIWWPDVNVVRTGMKLNERHSKLFSKAFLCERAGKYSTKADLEKADNVVFMRLHNGKSFILPVEYREDPANLFTDLVGWENPRELMKTFGKF